VFGLVCLARANIGGTNGAAYHHITLAEGVLPFYGSKEHSRWACRVGSPIDR